MIFAEPLLFYIMREYFSVSRVAWIFDVHPETVRMWIRRGKLKACIHDNKSGYQIAPDDFLNFYEKYRKPRKDK